MAHPLLSSCDTLEAYLTRVIEPAITVATSPVEIAAWQTQEPVAFAEAAKQRFIPVVLGWQWGPAWSTCWFKLMGTVPEQWRGKPVHVIFDSETEALLFDAGVPRQGFDPNRDTAQVLAAARGGERVELLIEAACNHPFGGVGLNWDSAETKRRWLSATPGRLHRAELVLRDEPTQRLVWAWQFALGVIRELCPPSPPMFTPSAPWAADQAVFQSGRAQQLHEALLRAMRMIRGREAGAVRAQVPAALALVLAALKREPGENAMVGHAVGHAHIDTAWLWPLRETRRKCQRTFSNVLRLMETDPDFRFMASSAQHYAMVEQDAPKLFEQIKARIAEGRWEPIGEMWVEPDCLITSPESLIRQILHGSRWFDSRFGELAGPKAMFLPDTFGFSGVIPQICKLSGIDTFITNKMAWNDTTPYPHTTFNWRGIDGTTVLAHFTPNHDYNAVNSPRELLRADKCHRSKQVAKPDFAPGEKPHGAQFLNPYGFGDGGGGPTTQQAFNAKLAEHCDGLPSVRPSGAKAFLSALHDDVRAFEAAGGELPVHNGELYLQAHRGCLTTQAWLKKAMRECEDLLRRAETLDVLHYMHCGTRVTAAHGLDQAWKTLLLNQFHDILPGSSIGWVYKDAREQMASVRAAAEVVAQQAMTGLGAKLGPEGMKGTEGMKGPEGMTGPERTEEFRATFDGNRFAGHSGCVFGRSVLPPSLVHSGTLKILHRDDSKRQLRVENGQRIVTIDELGRITSILTETDEEWLAGAANDAVLYEDVPKMWEAWDVDPEVLLKPEVQLRPATRWEVTQADERVVKLEVDRPIGISSLMRQTISFARGEVGAVTIRTRVLWKEKQSLLKLNFNPVLSPAVARYDSGFGFVERPITPSWPASRGMLEVSHHRYVWLNEAGKAFVVHNDCKYGSSVRHRPMASGGGTEIGMSVCRGTSYPDPDADQGEHEFSVSISATLNAETRLVLADKLCNPDLALVTTSGQSAQGVLMPVCGWDSADAGSEVQFVACKFAESDTQSDTPRSVIVRLVESFGSNVNARILRWHSSVARVEPVMLTVKPLAEPLRGFSQGENTSFTKLSFRPFQIITLKATLKS